MKKLSLEILGLTSDEVLGKSQMKKITGGSGNCQRVYCHCTDGGAGAWEGTYCSAAEIQAAVSMYCASSGVCN
ncbi:hypothetical protein [Aquiflexum sp.]|uniref:hypothetical protein n=1 Tax=Aquiflexum sp. TaxID=1872584 RepID=UPI0035942B98